MISNSLEIGKLHKLECSWTSTPAGYSFNPHKKQQKSVALEDIKNFDNGTIVLLVENFPNTWVCKVLIKAEIFWMQKDILTKI